MIIDKEAELTTTVAYDLGSVRPGPGQPIKMWFLPTAGTSPLAITDGATSAAADALMTVAYTVGEVVEFELPSNTAQFIKATFTGQLAASLAGVQTNG